MLSVVIERLVDDHFPGWVELLLVDAAGTRHVFIEKLPVVTMDVIDASTPLPQAARIACTHVSSRLDTVGRAVVCVDTRDPWGIESTTGETRFDVFTGQLASE